MRRLASKLLTFAITLLIGVLLAPNGLASAVSVGVGAFGPGSTLTTFTGIANGTEVNGLIVNGIQFSYSLGNGQLVIDGGPGRTNNINPPNIVSVGNPTGALTMVLPSAVDTFGYGYALLSVLSLTNATTISLFNGATPVGSLSYNSAPDATFSGGFAGIQSTLPFNRVQVTFISAPAFALDNIRTFSTVPEPSTMMLLGTGIASLLMYRRKQKAEVKAAWKANRV